MRSGPLPIPLPLQDGQVRGVHRPGSALRERRVRGGAEARAAHAHAPLAERVRPLERVPSRSTVERATSMPPSSWADLPVRLEISNTLPKRVCVCVWVGGCGSRCSPVDGGRVQYIFGETNARFFSIFALSLHSRARRTGTQRTFSTERALLRARAHSARCAAAVLLLEKCSVSERCRQPTRTETGEISTVSVR